MLDFPLVTLVPAGLPAQVSLGYGILQMILNASTMVKFVMAILGLFSVFSWAIIFMKYRLLRKAKIETDDFLELFWQNRELQEIYNYSEDLEYSPVARLFRSGYSEFGRIRRIQASLNSGGGADTSVRSQQSIMDNLDRSLKKATIDQTNRMERGVSFLATTGNTAPFIGLFGTVWGIMESFHGIGIKGSANLAVVAPGISEALVATAAGLAAAIPAVVAFNHFSQKISALKAEMDIFASEFLSTVERRFFRTLRAMRTAK
jgi:biopolymer transport protein TolQ